MAVEQFLLTLLVDPVDHEPLHYIADEEILFNPRRHVVFAINDGIPVLLPDEGRSIDVAEATRLSSLPAVVTGSGSTNN